ncbi:YheC/YheD family protein [Bacillus sp. FJAT-49736]|uniref:YheC/YheD family protein n=1 Tax=Bacillus sp. FJAT-49736 TaxID=2833582 RepID=UPI001BC9224E|nr:YheC/YheD family protein [Bacillus sp. FJAT-49736]MBS4174663.1 YheC/YheD family protein [Bacillus sp. FJAT-49736]
MVHTVGKLEQYKLLNSGQMKLGSIPTTVEYSMANLHLFLTKFEELYIKHDTSGQGRGIFKVTKGPYQLHTINGYSMQGQQINQKLTVKQIHELLQPFEKFGRSHPYIIQEGIKSVTDSGHPFSIRVHTQLVNSKWEVSGILANISSKQLDNNGIVNRCRGSQILPIEKLMKHYLKLNPKKERELLEKIKDVSICASETIASKYPAREYGIDVGVDNNLNPIIFELNSTPGIAGFHLVDPKIWRHIVDNRKGL